MKKETKKDKKKRLQTVADTLQAEVARYRLPCNKADLQQLVPEHSDNHLRDEEVWDSLEAELDLETELDLIMQRELAAPESEAKPLPLDPAALEELSVTYMFETKEGAEDMSPFALAVNMVMAIVGHMGPAKEFFMRARAIGSTFFDVTDYSVAEGLLALAYFCTGAENVSTMIYYLTLAHRMLVALNQTRGERRDIKRRAKLLEDYFNTSSLAYTLSFKSMP
ncbi:uncharacterized protein ACA1_077150 [Acanthamoeba castellanii str. Neff]|uniref:Uncharacterized protein n=1 Tax=Acanthamoeba castellanii (strain ATCC 30010 / Neff) TaxID=1257118 RepID=L8GNY9_ACACF|nr:uncharacterized protein ACA1_077150 [Acanthamoeba castellanii str. Neff]ELR13861.1 hypothetical protein ACA1_077150 [Acanthamoeba castellanii str. Neff]